MKHKFSTLGPSLSIVKVEARQDNVDENITHVIESILNKLDGTDDKGTCSSSYGLSNPILFYLGENHEYLDKFRLSCFASFTLMIDVNN